VASKARSIEKTSVVSLGTLGVIRKSEIARTSQGLRGEEPLRLA